MSELIKNLDFLGFPEYSISNSGVLYSHFTVKYYDNHIRGKCVDKSVLKIVTPIKQQSDNHNIQIRLNKAGMRLTFDVAYLVAKAFVDNPDNLHDINYLDNDLANLNAANLKWINKKFYLASGYSFKTTDGALCTIIMQTDNKHVDILIESDNVVGNIKGVIINTTIRSVKKKTIRHPFSPSVHGVGCIGIGPYTVSTCRNGIEVKDTIYSRWSAMLARCFIDKISKTYYGTMVSEEFKNYQQYAHFISYLMREHNITSLDDFEIDKDFKSQFGSGYCRETLTIIPKYLNGFLAARTLGAGILPPGVGYSPSRDEIRSKLVSETGVTLKWFRVSGDMEINIKNINFLINLYINEKIKIAQELLKRCYNDYPNLKLDKNVVFVLNNFSEYVINSVYLKNNWQLNIVNGAYELTPDMCDLIKKKFSDSNHTSGVRYTG